MLEDDAADAELTRFNLTKAGLHFSLVRVDSEEDFVRELQDHPPALILSDYSLPSFDGHSALRLARDLFILRHAMRIDQQAPDQVPRAVELHVMDVFYFLLLHRRECVEVRPALLQRL